jgi:hypothetical protein
MNIEHLFLLPPILKNNATIANPDILNNSIFSTKIPRKIVIPLYSNLVDKPLLDILLNVVKNNPDFEVHFYNPRKQYMWMKKIFHKHDSPISNLWDAFQYADTYRTKRDIFIYSWLFINGGISIFPELLPNMSLYNIKHKTSPNTPFTILFIEEGYFNNDIIITTPRAPILNKILEYCIHNILTNKSSSPIQREVHLPNDSATGKFTLRKAFLDYIGNPHFKIPKLGFKNNIIVGLTTEYKNRLFQENKALYATNNLLKQVSIGYHDL